MKTAIIAFAAAMVLGFAGHAYAQTATVSPTRTPSPSPTSVNNQQSDQNGVQQGVGGSAGTVTPSGAPNTGFGGSH